jgi:hypothetical protein
MQGFEQIQNIQKSLEDISNNLEETYFKMRKECMDEISNYVKEKETKKSEMSNLFDILSDSEDIKMRWIKNKLPWYITKFHKISSHEMSLRDESIFIGVCFGSRSRSNCYIEITPTDIGWKR